MEQKINARKSTVRVQVKNSDIYRRFKKEFEYLLHTAIHFDDDYYVTDPYEQQLTELLNNDSNQVICIIGPTGVGKTTLIKHCLHIPHNSPVRYGDTLVIPTFWDGKAIKNEMDCRRTIASSLDTACNVLDPEISIPFPVEKEIEDFYNYILNTRGDILYSIDVKTKRNKSAIDIIYDGLNLTANKSPIEYYSSKLKYMIEKYHPEIKHIVLVLDDIETISEKMQLCLVEQYHKILGCMPNNMNNGYTVNLIMSFRPFSYRFLNSNEYWGRESRAYYGAYYEIWKNKTADLSEIFKKRFIIAKKALGSDKNKESWNKSYEALSAIIGRMNASEKVSEMLLKLNLCNIRGVMDSLKIILCNRAWFQWNEAVSEHPHVEQEKYGCDNIVTIIRALACGENHFFDDKIDVIPYFFISNEININICQGMKFFYNLLSNSDGRCDVFCLFVIKYLFSNKMDFYNDNSIKVSRIKGLLRDVFSGKNQREKAQFDNTFDYAMKVLFHSRAIRKSINDVDTQKTLNKLSENNLIYLSQRGEIYWKMIPSDSMLLELFREDLLRKYTNDDYCMGSIEYRTYDKVYILYDDLLNLIKEIIRSEEQYVILASKNSNGINLYIEYFGLFEISFLFLQGVKESIRRSKYNDNNYLVNKLHDCDREISELQNYYRNNNHT